MNHAHAALNEARLIHNELEELHDVFDQEFGSSHEYTQKIMRIYCFSFGMMCDLEAALDNVDGE